MYSFYIFYYGGDKMKYIVSCSKMNSVKTLMNQFVEKLREIMSYYQ